MRQRRNYASLLMSKQAVIAICVYACLTETACVRKPRIMSAKEYAHHLYSVPQILDIKTPAGRIFYFGASHTNNPADPQISQIESMWAEFRPNVAFNEGGDPPVETTRNDAVTKFGEPGLVRFLAARDGVPVESIDPTRTAETAALLKQFTPEQVKLFFVLRQVSEYGHINRGTRSVDDQVRITLANLSRVPNLNVIPNSITDLEVLYSKCFPNRGDFRDVPTSWFDQTRADTFLNDIARHDNLYRDEYMVNLLVSEVQAGKRVFAVVGFTHVVCQQQVLRSRLRTGHKHQ